MKKTLSVLLAVALLFAALPLGAIPVFAATSGTTGDCTWTVYGTHLTISGNGRMGDYSHPSNVPWGKDITSVTINKGVTTISDYAFCNCFYLKSITIPNSVTSIGEEAFGSCHSLTSITIPYGVTAIEEYTFCNCTSLTSVIIPNSVTRIGSYAFYGCDSLTTVTIPDSVTSMGNYAFYGCDSLTSVTIGNGVTYIDDYTFYDCTSLTSITIPRSVSSIDVYAFFACTSLTDVYYGGNRADRAAMFVLESGNSRLLNATWYYARVDTGTTGDCTWTLDGNYHLTISGNGRMEDYSYASAPWGTSITAVTVEDGVTAIGKNAFTECMKLTSVTISDSVTEIGLEAFGACISLTSIFIPDSVTAIGKYAFRDCISLTSITVAEGNSEYCSEYGVLFNKDKTTLICFPSGKKGGYVIPDSVTTIGEYAFDNCDGLTFVTIPNSVTSIGYGTFSSCSNLTSVTIPVRVTTIGEFAFHWCRNLTDVYYGGDEQDRAAMIISDSANDPLHNATWHYSKECDHEWQDATCETPKTCTVCGETENGALGHDYDNVCDATCNACGLVRDAVGHRWDKGVCAVCGSVSPTRVTITTQPKAGNYAQEGKEVTATVEAMGDDLTYTWYIKNAGGTKYSKSSVTSATYSAKMSDKVHGRRVYCVITDQYGNAVQSATAILRRQATITSESATAAYAAMGETATAKITAMGDDLTYQWYYKNAGATKYSRSSITTDTYTVAMSSKVKGRRIYCLVKDKYGKTVQSKTFLLREAASITAEPATATYAQNGATAKVTIGASGDGLTYTWYIKNAGGTKYTKSSIASNTYSVKMSDKVNGRRIYCVVKDKYGNTVQTKTMILKKK